MVCLIKRPAHGLVVRACEVPSGTLGNAPSRQGPFPIDIYVARRSKSMPVIYTPMKSMIAMLSRI